MYEEKIDEEEDEDDEEDDEEAQSSYRMNIENDISNTKEDEEDEVKPIDEDNLKSTHEEKTNPLDKRITIDMSAFEKMNISEEPYIKEENVDATKKSMDVKEDISEIKWDKKDEKDEDMKHTDKDNTKPCSVELKVEFILAPSTVETDSNEFSSPRHKITKVKRHRKSKSEAVSPTHTVSFQVERTKRQSEKRTKKPKEEKLHYEDDHELNSNIKEEKKKKSNKKEETSSKKSKADAYLVESIPSKSTDTTSKSSDKKMNPSNSNEKVLTDILSCDNEKASFQNFLKGNNYNAVYITLLDSIHEYKNEKSSKAMNLAKRILDRYFPKKMALSQIKCSDKIRKEIFNKYERILQGEEKKRKKLFDPLEKDIMQMMASNYVPMFLKSDYHKK